MKSEVLNEGLVLLELREEDSTILYASPILVNDKDKSIGGITNQVVKISDNRLRRHSIIKNCI
ncbi:hypothetical protein SDC9_104581 [bioreactor metagenome]|uniref:Uncharacterized protein n=1 Tax=bioreactor metagenome TaxID=1076179 RepID=A0A645AYC4_9ZZZZ|nr:hypothetical protein [Petrimonas sp.]